MMYVYQRNNDIGVEQYVGIYETKEEATHKIELCYETDKERNQLGLYYYFMKEH